MMPDDKPQKTSNYQDIVEEITTVSLDKEGKKTTEITKQINPEKLETYLKDLDNDIKKVQTYLSRQEAAWTDYSGTSTITGWSSITTKIINIKVIRNIVFVNFYITGTSDSTAVTFTLAHTAIGGANYGGAMELAVDNGVTLTVAARCYIGNTSVTVTCYSNMGTGAWTASGTKSVGGNLWFQIA